MNKLLIELIITNSCNKKCEYCDLDFRNIFISDEIISLFNKFIREEEKKVDYFHINFFG
jgi:sulfatase maturation enzyme AslB (radical SAM superfamily)